MFCAYRSCERSCWLVACCAGSGSPRPWVPRNAEISLAVLNCLGLVWWSVGCIGPAALLLLRWAAVPALAKFAPDVCMVNWIDQLTNTLMGLSNSNPQQKEQRFSQGHCYAFRPILDSSGGLSKNVLGQGCEVKLSQASSFNLAYEAFKCFFEKTFESFMWKGFFRKKTFESHVTVINQHQRCLWTSGGQTVSWALLQEP